MEFGCSRNTANQKAYPMHREVIDHIGAGTR
jgi:hypothetical protein